MKCSNTFNRFSQPILLFILVLLPQLLLSQSKTYIGPLQLEELFGYANFEYKLVRQDTILNGSFQMKGSNNDTSAEGKINYFSVEGNYSDNIPNGNWNIQFGDFSNYGESSLENYILEMKLYGRLQELVAKIDQGIIDDKQFWVYDINQSNIVDTFFISELINANATAEGRLYLANKFANLRGSISKDGHADGNWKLESNSTESSYVLKFENGWLRSIEEENNNAFVEITIFDKGNASSKAIDFSSNYFYVLNLLQKLRNQDLLLAELSTLTTENENVQIAMDNLLIKLGVNLSSSDIKVLLPHYPLTTSEESNLSAIKKNLKKASALFSDILKNPQLESLKLSQDTVLFYLSAKEEIELRFIEPIRKLEEFEKEHILEFLPRINIMNLIFSDSLDAEFNVVFEDSSNVFKMHEVDKLDNEERGLKNLDDLTEAVVQTLDSLMQKIDVKLKKYERKQQLTALERELISLKNKFNAIVDSTVTENINPYSDLILNIQEYTKKEIGKYWKSNSEVIRMAKVEVLVDCVENMKNLVQLISEIPKINEAIKETYTKEVWNTFTASTMNEISKKRIYNAYMNVILPHNINQIREGLKCNNVTKSIDVLNDAHSRMFELNEERTRDIETKLRNTTDKEFISKTLNILLID